jgi:pyridoxal phosphate enzyme (YggS family)
MKLDFGQFDRNLRSVRQRMARAAARSGREARDIRLMAVTKTFPVDYVETARRAGLSLFGENRVQEAREKYGSLVGASELELHLIGHLQRNKAGIAASLFRCVQSIDKLQTAETLNRHCARLGRSMDVLLELNTSGEPGKYGFADSEQLWHACEDIAGQDHLRVRGVMTVGPLTADRDRVRRAFAVLRECLVGLEERFPELPLDTLSMGMSGDFEIAIEEGANLIRVGTVLFGRRSGAETCGAGDGGAGDARGGGGEAPGRGVNGGAAHD